MVICSLVNEMARVSIRQSTVLNSIDSNLHRADNRIGAYPGGDQHAGFNVPSHIDALLLW